jgi:hypothetical protein
MSKKLDRRSKWAESIYNYVAQHPGCSKADVARYIAHNPNAYSHVYGPVNTAIRCGNIRAVPRGNRYALFTHELVDL